MQAWLREFWDEPLTFATICGGLILLVMLWAMALLTRKVRVAQSQLDSVKEELRFLNEAIKMLTSGMRDPGRPLELARPTSAPPVEEPARVSIAPSDLPPMPPDP